MLILGVDGFDPKLVNQYLAAGELPEIAKLLAAGGEFREIATTYPPQSPVAWSTVAIGANPGQHGIFDFIHRDPTTLAPEFSASKTTLPQSSLGFGSFQLPLESAKALNLRQGTSFWQLLCEHGVPSTICAMPTNYPPDCPCHDGPLKILSGMGTPDILGTQGTATIFTTKAPETERSLGGLEIVEVALQDLTATTELLGPANPYRKETLPTDISLSNSQLRLPLEITVDPPRKVAKVSISGREILLNQGEFSDWVPIEFPIFPGVLGSFTNGIPAIVRFFLKEISPQFQLYASPVNIDPARPAVDISFPATYATELAQEIGPFYTQNMPPDTKALEHNVFSDAEFLKQIELVFAEEKKRYFAELKNFRQGLLFHYFGTIDQLSHMFWRTIDHEHPSYSPQLNARHGQVIRQYYQEIDQVIGQTLKSIDQDTVLLLVSDHGFTSFRWGVNLNTILLNLGYITLKESAATGSSDLFNNVDWQKTQAYGLGLNGLYINLKDREAFGSVPISKSLAIQKKIRQDLLDYIDPIRNLKPFAHVARKTEIYYGPYLEKAPDLIVSYSENYRASWETVLGSLPKKEIVTNTSPWSGDHSVHSKLVPGVLISNQPLTNSKHPDLRDLAPTILAYFGVEPTVEMDGIPLFTTKNLAERD